MSAIDRRSTNFSKGRDWDKRCSNLDLYGMPILMNDLDQFEWLLLIDKIAFKPTMLIFLWSIMFRWGAFVISCLVPNFCLRFDELRIMFWSAWIIAVWSSRKKNDNHTRNFLRKRVIARLPHEYPHRSELYQLLNVIMLSTNRAKAEAY